MQCNQSTISTLRLAIQTLTSVWSPAMRDSSVWSPARRDFCSKVLRFPCLQRPLLLMWQSFCLNPGDNTRLCFDYTRGVFDILVMSGTWLSYSLSRLLETSRIPHPTWVYLRGIRIDISLSLGYFNRLDSRLHTWWFSGLILLVRYTDDL